MPNVSHDLTPRFEGDIDAEVVDSFVDTVGPKGWADVESRYGGHLIAWAPLVTRGQIHTTTYNQTKKEKVQSYAQQDGGVNIGTEEWAGERIVLLVLDRTLDD